MKFFVWLLIIGFGIGVVYFFYYILSRCAKTIKRQSVTKSRLGAYSHSAMLHVKGLPVAANVSTEIYDCNSRFVFFASGQEISLAKDKIMSIEVTTGSGIGHTAAGAVAGKYILGGSTGALFGALAATKTYCVITYQKENKPSFIVLDTAMSGTFAHKLAKEFSQETSHTVKSVEL